MSTLAFVERHSSFQSGCSEDVSPTMTGRERSSSYRQRCVDDFLKQHGFKDVNDPVRDPCTAWLRRETIYPIHLAAKTGDLKVLLLLLASGADPEVMSSSGRKAWHFAKEANKDNSHRDVLQLLSSQQISVKQMGEKRSSETTVWDRDIDHLDSLLRTAVRQVEL
ncbi:unnamed protein product [Durusdinium trenchii]|uniref:NADPH-dependent diflavin oxidoreductase 1 n=2 Tax=Durusdinium trenchii TaxID=1381693 RepID=A0ABP0QJW4_9DINO